jgi:flagellar hook-associated protein 1 FlgK
MSIQGALNAAVSSLAYQQQQLQVLSNNIANASTPGYTEETLPAQEQVTGGIGSGVEAGALQQLANQMLASSANQAASTQSYSQTMLDLLTNFTQAVGTPTDSTSLAGSLSAFQQALTSLSATPGDATAQSAAIAAAQALVDAFHAASAAVAATREQANQGIAQDVSDANALLAKLAQNQTAIQLAAANHEPTASFEDTQNTLLASLAKIVPLDVLSNGTSGIAVTTDGGTTLLDGGVAQTLDFTPTPSVSAQARSLPGVTVSGTPIAISQNGSLAANLQAQNVTLPQFGAQLDAMAANLIGAFQTADPTVTPGTAGLFTDAASPLPIGATPTGLAGQIALNASVDPAQGGEAWRISAGAQATAEAASSDSSVVVGFLNAMNTAQNYSAATGLPAAATLGVAASQSAALQQSALSTWTTTNQDRTQQAQNAQSALANATGVNVDEELQRMLIVQQTYSASSEVLQAASKMLAALTAAVSASA